MKLRELLIPSRILIPLEAATVKEATHQLAALLVETGAVAEPNRFQALVRNAWPEDLASVGEHAFLPHFRTEAVRALVVAVGVARAPIPSDRDPNRVARVVILIVAPQREATTYLHVMGALARALSDPDTLAALVAARTADDVVNLAGLADIELASHQLVRDVMATDVVTAGPDTLLGDAAQLLMERGLRALPIVDEGGALLGMLTDRDVLRFFLPSYLQRTKSGAVRALTKSQIQAGSADPRHIAVRDIMARGVLCLAEDQALSDAANLMSTKEIDAFPVVREGKVVGFLTRAELIRRLVAL